MQKNLGRNWMAIRRRRVFEVTVSVSVAIILCIVMALVVSHIHVTLRMSHMETSLATFRMEFNRLQTEKSLHVNNHVKRRERAINSNLSADASFSRLLSVSIQEQINANHPFSHIRVYNFDNRHTARYPDKQSVAWIDDWRNSYASSFTQNDLFSFEENSTKMMIHVMGIYFIYVQVTFAGVVNGYPSRPTCSYTLKISNEEKNIEKILLYGSVTQYNLGRTIMTYKLQDVYVDVRAQDSVYQAGIFKLEPSDRLHLEMDNRSGHCLIVTNRDQTYLGAFRLASL